MFARLLGVTPGRGDYMVFAREDVYVAMDEAMSALAITQDRAEQAIVLCRIRLSA